MVHLTGTTALKTNKILKFVLLDYPNSHPCIRKLLEVLGLSLERKSMERITILPVASLRTNFTALGYKATTSTPSQTMIDAMVQQHPSDSLVHQKLLTGWCMAPIKSKRKEIVESFRQGNISR
jgi:hypothetical protein